MGPAASSLGLRRFHDMVSAYARADQKKLHDLVAGLCVLDPARTGCAFRRVSLGSTQPRLLPGHCMEGGRYRV